MDAIGGHFKSTRWTTVLRAGHQGAPGAEAALARLCEDYRPPLLEFARFWLKNPDEAEDLTQSFFCHFIERNLPASAGRERGRFRTFLLACFKNFVRDEWRRRKRARVIPPEMVCSLDAPADAGELAFEPAVTPGLERELDRLWAESIRQRVIAALEADYRARNNGRLFDNLRGLLTGDDLNKPYSELAAELGVSKDAIKTAVLRLRERFRQRFRDEVAQTVGNLEEVEAESRYLQSLLFSVEETG